MHEAQVQEHVQRQAAQFCERIQQAMSPLEDSPRREINDAALRGCLLYVTSAIEIATGREPDLNLLDLYVFHRLCREAFAQHWIPTVYGELGLEVLATLERSEHDVGDVVSLAFGEAKREELERIVDEWRQDNVGMFRVEGVRLDDFAHHAGRAARQRAERARGFLSSVKTATQTADRAVLLAERGLFLVNRMPFLLRLQSRLAIREITTDLLARLTALPSELVRPAREAVQARITGRSSLRRRRWFGR
jgi:hypothetical protein